MPANRPTLYAGLVLIALGIIFLITYFLPAAWPVLLVGLGGFFLVAAFFWRASGLAVSGTVNATLGLVLLYQAVTNRWESWFFLWPLIFAAVGAGMLLTRALEPANASWRSERYLRVSWGWLVLGLAAPLALWFFRAQIHWPVILWGMGILFLLETLISGIRPLAIPGVILGGLGLLLAWQNATGAWESWVYAWALIPAFVGLGLLLAFLHSRTMRIVGFSMLSWSLVVFALFGFIFAGQGALARFWPFALILAGVAVLVQSLLVRRPVQKQLADRGE